jgi:ADP-heptose:LPS heptosyltransferase
MRSFIALADRLLAGGIRVVFSIGPEDVWCGEVLDTARSHVRGLPRYSGGLGKLPALLQSAALVVSNSTGPLHLAAALGRPTLGFYAPWSTCGVARWGPYSARGWALAAECAEARNWSHGDRRRMGEQLLALIPSEVAAHCVTAILENRPPSI